MNEQIIELGNDTKMKINFHVIHSTFIYSFCSACVWMCVASYNCLILLCFISLYGIEIYYIKASRFYLKFTYLLFLIKLFHVVWIEWIKEQQHCMHRLTPTAHELCDCYKWSEDGNLKFNNLNIESESGNYFDWMYANIFMISVGE
jgi:hypothetical protein